ncbi:MAG: hypothetical protein WA807_05090 [Steroidobacteraceae bacterium]
MRKSIWLLAVAAVVFAGWHFLSNGQPSVQQIEPLLKDFLKSGDCSGTLVLERLDSVSIGAFSTQMGGWPIYAAHVETCHEGGKSTTYDGSRDAEHKIAAVFARRSVIGNLELYTPTIFQSAQRDMKLSLQKAFDSAQAK